nr:MAG TPA: hypothetical protein [Caudoviricetes sp.]
MGNLKAHTTHTVKLSWAFGDPLEKSELIRGLSDVLPEGAVITELKADVLSDPATRNRGSKSHANSHNHVPRKPGPRALQEAVTWLSTASRKML